MSNDKNVVQDVSMTELFKKVLCKEFEPCVIEHEELKFTEMVLKDCLIVWTPWKATSHMGHAVDLGYDIDGNLVGIKIWDTVAKK